MLLRTSMRPRSGDTIRAKKCWSVRWCYGDCCNAPHSLRLPRPAVRRLVGADVALRTGGVVHAVEQRYASRLGLFRGHRAYLLDERATGSEEVYVLTEEQIGELWDEAVGDGWSLCRQAVICFARLVEREIKLSVFADAAAKALVAWAAEYAKANLWRTGEPPVAAWYLVPRRECNAPGDYVPTPYFSATIEAYWGGADWVDAAGMSYIYQPVHYMPEPEFPEEDRECPRGSA